MTDGGKSHLDRYRALIEARLSDIASAWLTEPTLKDAMVYALEAGKKLRGAILLSFCEGLGGRTEEALGFAAALEMVHAYSLVHDDLPCMDNDDFRRGKPSCHRQFGFATALLAGDALLAAAFEAAASPGPSGLPGPSGSWGSPAQAAAGLPPGAVARAILVLSRAAGPSGMVAGQVLDLALEGKVTCPARVREMYVLKTGALFEASARIGAILAGAGEEAERAAGEWGSRFGYAYQILDDLEDQEQSGKEQEKDTLARETSPQAARREAARALGESLSSLQVLGRAARFAEELTRAYLAKSRGL